MRIKSSYAELRERRRLRDQARMPQIVARNRRWRAANYEKMTANNVIQSARIRARNNAFIRSVKDAPCMDCGVKHIPFAMDFDHVRGVKARNVSKLTYCSLDRLRAEIAKCDVVCSNCHRYRTFKRLNAN